MRSCKTVIAGGLVLTLAAISGCATMSEAECQNANWQLRGEDDGNSGYRRDRVNSHTRACAEYGIKPDVAAYARGWEQGIRNFCTRDNGWEHGLAGKTYQNSCPDVQKAAFFEAFSLGSAIAEQQGKVGSLNTQLNTVNTKLDGMASDDEDYADLKKRQSNLQVDHARAEADLLRAQLEAQKQGFSLP